MAKDDVNNVGAGRAAKGAIPVIASRQELRVGAILREQNALPYAVQQKSKTSCIFTAGKRILDFNLILGGIT